MKNLKVSRKLLTNSIITILLTVIVGFVGIYGMSQLSNSFSSMYENQTVPMPYMTKIIEMLQRQRACMREYILAAGIIIDAENDAERQLGLNIIDDARDRVMEYQEEQAINMDLYQATITKGHPAEAIFGEARRLYETDFFECLELIYTGAKAGEPPYELYMLMSEYSANINKVVDDFDECLEMKVAVAKEADEAGNALFSSLMVIIIIVLVVSFAVAMFLSIYISGLISKPLSVLRDYLDDAGSKGVLEMTPEEKRLIPIYSQHKDEIGDILKASQKFLNHVSNIAGQLERISSGDLTVDIEVLSEEDVLGNSLFRMEENLNNMFGEINSSTGQVSSGAKQIADGAQTLAQGSTEQAASVQQLSSSIAEVASKTKENADMAGKAADLASTIKGNAEKGSRQMDEMMTAVKDINDASQNISKVIKTIDDIAFQTNILALNAAVEAARAGQHGKGFAVVAEEVRNLAAKSADAAKETGEMIQNSMDKAELGSRIAGETATSLSEIVTGINESTALISEIAQSSDQQSVSIEQINKGVDQVAQVVQQNSATAEESAAAAEQMSGQSDMLQGLVEQFKLKGGNSMSHMSLPSAPPPSHTSSSALPETTGEGGDFGKY